MSILKKRRSLSTNFLIFGLFSLGIILIFTIGFWLQLYYEELEKKHLALADETNRVSSILSDTMDYITQYTAFIGEKIAKHDNPHDLKYIDSLIDADSNKISLEDKFYFTTTFDWVTPDKMLRVSNKIGILPTPFDMGDRDYLTKTPQHPWTLQLSMPRLGGLSKQWIVPAGMGITDERGNFLGSITLGFSLSGLEQRINRILGPTNTEYLILTENLEPILDSSMDNAVGPDPNFKSLNIDTSTWKNEGYLAEPIIYRDTQFSHFKKLSHYPYIVLSGYDEHMATALFNKMVLSRGAILFIIIFTTSALLYWMRRRFIKPIMALAQAADNIRHRKEVMLDENPISEINILRLELQKIAEYVQNEHRINSELSQKTRQLEVLTQEALLARDSAIKANNAKSEFLANMSHELRTPLNVIIGLTNIMLGGSRKAVERQKEFLETMYVSSQTLLELINNLLDIAKIESDHIELEKVNFNFKDMVEEVVSMLSVGASEKNIHLTSHYDKALPEFIIGDPTRLKQILTNLASNAIKFTKHGHVAIHITASHNNSNMLIEVSDTGIGIPAEKLQSIFDKFSQADTSITRRYGGTGLGLALTKTLVECMGGTISVKSEIGQGSVFSVSIPLILAHKQNDAGIISYTKENNAPVMVRSKQIPVVLLVEDHKPNILIATNLLENLGCAYEIATNGNDATERVKKGGFDLILMDIQMPDMDGFRATKMIREYEKLKGLPPVPIIGLTAYALSGDREKCIKAGMNDYLSKPIELEKFNEVIMRFLEAKYPVTLIGDEMHALSKKIH